MSAGSDLVATPLPAERRRTPVGRAVLAQARMELRLLLRSGESLLATLGIPLGILVFFSAVDVLPTGGRRAVEFLVPGVLAIAVMSTGLVSLAIATAFERKYGVLKLLGGSPLPRWGLLAGKALAVVAVLVAQTILVLAIAALGLGWDPSGGVLAVATGLVLGALTFSALGLLMAGTLRAEGTLALSNTFYLVLLLVSGLFFEADALPGPVAALGRVLPSGALGDALRAGFADDPSIAVGAVIVLAAWGLLAAFLAARTFRWEP